MVGVHTPEFLFEADPGNVGRAVRDLGIRYPVVLDPEYATWDAYGNRYWPTTYLIDRDGQVRDLHVGEGDEARTEALVRAGGRPVARRTAVDADVRDTPIGPAVDPRSAPRAGDATSGHATDRAPRLPPRGPRRRLDRGRRGDQAGAGAALELSFHGRGRVPGAGRGRRAARRARCCSTGAGRPRPEAGRDVGPGGRLVVTGAAALPAAEISPGRRTGRMRIELAPGTRAYAFTFG